MAATAPSLTCGQCKYVNEPERVYCHNCGAKLDRSILPKEDDTKARESIEKTRARVRKLTNPGGGGVMREVKTALSTLIWALVVAFLIQAAREPEWLPGKSDAAPRIISSEIMQALESPRPVQLVFSEADVNAYLKSALRAKVSASALPGVTFEQAFVKLENGLIRIGIRQSLFGFPVYSGVFYKLEVKDGNFLATQQGGSFGRAGVHPALMKYVDFAFEKVWPALKREHEQMGRMQSIAIAEGRIGFITKGK